jgi:Multiubiquitin
MSPGDHDKKPLTIIVNTRSLEWTEKEITYEQAYDLAYPRQPLGDGDTATIEYSRGPHGNGGGSLPFLLCRIPDMASGLVLWWS